MTGSQDLLDAPDPPAAVRTYLKCVELENPEGGLRFYPGSPRIAERLTRPGDDIILAELHPQALEALRLTFRRTGRVHIHKRDGFEALAALLPPKQKRGVVLIDPAYEEKSDYERTVQTIERAYKRWSTGGYLLWYPLLPAGRHEDMLSALRETGIRKILRSEWHHRPAGGERGLYGSGMAIVNPSWKTDEDDPRHHGLAARYRFRVGPGHSRLACAGIAGRGNPIRSDSSGRSRRDRRTRLPYGSTTDSGRPCPRTYPGLRRAGSARASCHPGSDGTSRSHACSGCD